MFYAFLLSLLIIASAILILAILMQAGKGGGLAANFGGAGSSSDSFLGSRQASNLLTKASWTAGGVFLALSFILSQMSARTAAVPRSVLEDGSSSAPMQTPPPTSSSSAPMTGIPLIPVPVKAESGGGKAAPVGKAPAEKSGDAKTPPKVPPSEH